MTIDQFWEIIELSRRRVVTGDPNGNMDRQLEDLRGLLSQRSSAEVLEFRDHFVRLMDQAYTWDLWGAAYVIAQGCSDDGFTDFRSWLISMGRIVFERSLADPESLVAAASAPEVEDVFFEGFAYIPESVYEAMTGREAPEYPSPRPSEPRGEKWEEGDLERRFPKLWRKFG